MRRNPISNLSTPELVVGGVVVLGVVGTIGFLLAQRQFNQLATQVASSSPPLNASVQGASVSSIPNNASVNQEIPSPGTQTYPWLNSVDNPIG